MTYVDDLHTQGKKVWCHLYADTIKELRRMAERLKVEVKDGEDEHRPHLDLSEHQRELSLRYGAKEQ